MRFTEHELTSALTGAAKSVAASRKRLRKGADIDEAWNAMGRYERFQLLDALGDQILPVLVALPDVEVEVGARPTYTTAQVQQVVADLVGNDLGRLRRLAVVKSRTALVQIALRHVPPRRDSGPLGQP